MHLPSKTLAYFNKEIGWNHKRITTMLSTDHWIFLHIKPNAVMRAGKRCTKQEIDGILRLCDEDSLDYYATGSEERKQFNFGENCCMALD